MPILVDRKSHVLVHGVEGDVVSVVHQLLAYGTKVVAYIDAGKGGTSLLDLPYFDTVERAKKQSGANVSLIFTRPEMAADAILEAEEASIPLIICATPSLPLHDMAEVQRILRRNKRSRLIGPGSYGLITPGQSKIGSMPGYVYAPGEVGIVSRFGTLMDEVAWHLTSANIGQSTCVHLGEFPLLGTSMEEIIALFEKDERTETIIAIGEPADFRSLPSSKKKIVGLVIGGKPLKGKIPLYDDIQALVQELAHR